jgi:hypothetical protein
VKASVLDGKATDGRYLSTIRLDSEHEARAHRITIDENCARSADALATAITNVGRAQALPQSVEKELVGRHL